MKDKASKGEAAPHANVGPGTAPTSL
jgi:hypothetical protein